MPILIRHATSSTPESFMGLDTWILVDGPGGSKHRVVAVFAGEDGAVWMIVDSPFRLHHTHCVSVWYESGVPDRITARVRRTPRLRRIHPSNATHHPHLLEILAILSTRAARLGVDLIRMLHGFIT